MVMDNVLDGGYGALENLEMKLFLDSLPRKLREEYEQKLEFENQKQYLEYKEWEKIFKD